MHYRSCCTLDIIRYVKMLFLNSYDMETIKNINDYITCVLSYSKGEDKVVFRGEPSVTYNLQPSIGRKNYTQDLEKDIFLEFKRLYHSYTNEKPKDDMDVLFLAQHYGLPTRLLDWSYNPLAALFFACENEEKSEEEQDGRVYIHRLSAKKLNDASLKKGMPHSIDEIIKIEENLFVVPDYTDARYRNQQALFLVCRNPNEITTLEDMTPLIIDKEHKKEILEQLATLGYDRTFIYPMLESLCKDIKKRLIK